MSPGTIVSETNTEEIPSYDVNRAIEMSYEITQRHGATPYGFYFSTKERKDDELDSKVTHTSAMYYLGGTVQTLEEVKADPESTSILIANMEGNGWDRVLTNTNSYSITLPLNKNDVVLSDYTPKN